MLISGLQKLTLLDYPGLIACTVFWRLQLPLPVLPQRPSGAAGELATTRTRQVRLRVVLDGVAITEARTAAAQRHRRVSARKDARSASG